MVTRYTYWVSMNDSFMSNWGKSVGKTNRLVFTAVDYDEAETIAKNAKRRGDMKSISISSTRPKLSKTKYYVEYKNKRTSPNWYKKNFW